MALRLQLAQEGVEAKRSEIAQYPWQEDGGRVGDPQHVEGRGVVGQYQGTVPPWPPPQAFPTGAELEGTEAEGRGAVQCGEVRIILIEEEQRTPVDEKEAAEAGLGLQSRLAVVPVTVVDAEIVGIERKLLRGDGALAPQLIVGGVDERGTFLVDVVETEFPKRLEIAAGPAPLQFGNCRPKLLLQPAQYLQSDRRRVGVAGLVPGLPGEAGGLSAAERAASLQCRVDQAEAGELVEGGVDPAVEGDAGGDGSRRRVDGGA